MTTEIRGIDMELLIPSEASPSQLLAIDCVSELGMQVTNSSEEKTTKGSQQQRELSTRSALKSYSCDVQFVADSASEEFAVLVETADASDPKLAGAQVKVGGLRTYTGDWLISNFDWKSGSSGVVSGSFTLENASPIEAEEVEEI